MVCFSHGVISYDKQYLLNVWVEYNNFCLCWISKYLGFSFAKMMVSNIYLCMVVFFILSISLCRLYWDWMRILMYWKNYLCVFYWVITQKQLLLNNLELSQRIDKVHQSNLSNSNFKDMDFFSNYRSFEVGRIRSVEVQLNGIRNVKIIKQL